MIRRTPINVWPAIADLMTLLAVIQVPVIVALTAEGRALRARAEALRIENDKHERTIGDLRAIVAAPPSPTTAPSSAPAPAAESREAALNEAMFAAIQLAQRIVEAVGSETGLKANPDQSLQFGEDLVEFDLNGSEPRWKRDSRQRLRKFCERLAPHMRRTLPGLGLVRGLISVQVEGHTDSTQCPGNPSCNWWFSANRAVAFATQMRDPALCPGGDTWDLRPIGYADTRPLLSASGNSQTARRVAVRLIPNYDSMIARHRQCPNASSGGDCDQGGEP